MKDVINVDPLTGKQYKIKPFMLLRDKYMHSQSLKKDLKFDWCPLFTRMSSAPVLNFHSRLDDITCRDISSSYTIDTEYINENYIYLFVDVKEALIVTCLIGTWSCKLLPSEVEKNRTISDKANQTKKATQKKGPAKKRKKRATEKDDRIKKKQT